MVYSVFGLSVAANWAIPGLAPQPAACRPDVHIWLQRVSSFPAVCDSTQELYYVSAGDTTAAPALRVWRVGAGEYFRMRYDDGTEFLVDRDGREVWVISPESSTLEDTATYLLGPVLGFVLRRRGITCLHASVVAIDGCAVAIAGPAGAGKSTAAALFAAMGYTVLADDIAAVVNRDGVPHIQPAYPQLRLWPDSVGMLYGSADALPPLTPTWDKRALALAGHAFCDRPLPLAAVYVLAYRTDEAAPVIEIVTGAERLLALLANTYVGYLVDDAMRRHEFDVLSRLASTVHVRRIRRPGSSDVAATYTQLLEDYERLRCTPSATLAR